MDAHIDLIGPGGSQGPVANAMSGIGGLSLGRMQPWIGDDGQAYITTYKGGSPKAASSYRTESINTNATLRRNEWQQLDEELTMISRSRLGGVQDLIDKGLTKNLGNAMGTTVLVYQDVSEALEAITTMDGITRGQNDRVEYETKYLPIPITHVDFEINRRVLETSRNLGAGLDTTLAEQAGRRVLETIEAMLFTDVSYTYGGGTIYSYLNAPNRNTGSMTADWNDSAATGATILADVLAMKQALIDAKHFGPYQIYIPTAYETVLDGDYDVSGSSLKTIRERILDIAGIDGIKVIDTLTADNVLMVQMTSDVVRLVQGMPLSIIEWKQEGDFITKYKALTIQLPQIRSDQDGNSGIANWT